MVGVGGVAVADDLAVDAGATGLGVFEFFEHEDGKHTLVRFSPPLSLRAIADERGPVSADRARSSLSALYAWAIGEGLWVWRSRIGHWRRGGPSITALGVMPCTGIWSWTMSMSRVRGVR